MKKLTPLQNALYMIGAILLLMGAATYITKWVGAFYLYTVGAFLFSSMQMLASYEGRNLVIRRLRRQQLMGALAILFTSCLMAMNTFQFGFARRNEWIACLTVACILELYTVFRISSELEKEKK